jgi:hypothetical protein
MKYLLALIAVAVVAGHIFYSHYHASHQVKASSELPKTYLESPHLEKGVNLGEFELTLLSNMSGSKCLDGSSYGF